jgi:endonuclease/exonuclease/phosphatase family metal-dependent hydrolase
MLIGKADSPTLHVMSFNLRNAGDWGDDHWPARRPITKALLDDELPTVIGTQEGVYQSIQDVKADLPSHYDWIGLGRGGGSRDEFAAIYYDGNRLQPREFDHLWLSDTPRLVASSTWGNTCVRMATWIRFHDAATGKEFVALNTHLDHETPAAQINGARLLVELLGNFTDIPVIVTGDFNVPAEYSEPYEILVGKGGLTDTWLTAERRLSSTVATFHGYRKAVPNGERIDWILTSPSVRTREAAINQFALDGRFGSDHFPVQASIELP